MNKKRPSTIFVPCRCGRDDLSLKRLDTGTLCISCPECGLEGPCAGTPFGARKAWNSMRTNEEKKG